MEYAHADQHRTVYLIVSDEEMKTGAVIAWCETHDRPLDQMWKQLGEIECEHSGRDGMPCRGGFREICLTGKHDRTVTVNIEASEEMTRFIPVPIEPGVLVAR